jgi:hypothetical protein
MSVIGGHQTDIVSQTRHKGVTRIPGVVPKSIDVLPAAGDICNHPGMIDDELPGRLSPGTATRDLIATREVGLRVHRFWRRAM